MRVYHRTGSKTGVGVAEAVAVGLGRIVGCGVGVGVSVGKGGGVRRGVAVGVGVAVKVGEVCSWALKWPEVDKTARRISMRTNRDGTKGCASQSCRVFS